MPPFSWTHDSPPAAQSSLSISSPPSVWLSERDMKLYGPTPNFEPGLVKCNDCDKVVLRTFTQEHSANCRTIRAKKKGKFAEPDGSKKRKTSPTDDSLPSKKKLKTSASGGSTNPSGTNAGPGGGSRRHKGPIDYDKHCGVINDKGFPCSRSLTCKSHSMGAKRAVQGRSRAYDELLMQWQRENNPNWVEPVKRETKAERKEKKEREKAEKKRLAEEAAIAAGIDLSTLNASGSGTKKSSGNSKDPASGSGTTGTSQKKSKKAAAAAAVAAAAAKGAEDLAEDVPENLDLIDSEAELEDMVTALRSARNNGSVAVPLAVPCDVGSWFVQRREKVRCCRDLLFSALGGTPMSAIPMSASGGIPGTQSGPASARLSMG